jgi:hypothetical protein
LASISAPKFEAIKKRKNSKTEVIGVAAIIEGKIMNLSVEAKVAIAVGDELGRVDRGCHGPRVANPAAIRNRAPSVGQIIRPNLSFLIHPSNLSSLPFHNFSFFLHPFRPLDSYLAQAELLCAEWAA